MLVCATTIENRNVLLVMHSDPEKPDYGNWLLPAGSVEPDESLKEALKRERREETGLRIRIARKLVEHIDPYTHDRMVNFLCIPLTSEIEMSSELRDAKWFGIWEIRKLENIHSGLKQFLIDGLESGSFNNDF